MLKNEMKKVLTISQSGIPCLWECGGASTNTGYAEIISNKFGKQKKAIYIPTKGPLSNGNHALVPVAVGDKVTINTVHRESNEISIYKITEISGDLATLVCVRDLKLNIHNLENECFPDAVIASIEKANDYHCRTVYFVLPPNHTYKDATSR